MGDDYYTERILPPRRQMQHAPRTRQRREQTETATRNLPFKTVDYEAPPLTKPQEAALKKTYYDDNYSFGRDKLWRYLRENKPELKISRRQVWGWLSKQETHQRYQDAKAATAQDIKSTVATAPHKLLAIDLKDMQLHKIDGMEYIFGAVDLFSRKLYAVPMKDKEDKTALAAFKKIHAKIPDISALKSDNGSEFVSDVFKAYVKSKGIKHVFSSSGKPSSNGAIEEKNKQLSRLIGKAILRNKDFNWVKRLPKIVKAINSTVNKETGKTAEQIEKAFKDKDEDLLKEVYAKEVANKSKRHKLSKQEYEKGDQVRKYEPNEKYKGMNWTAQLFVIERVFTPQQGYGVYEYTLKNDPDKMRYKNEELMKIKEVDNINEVVKRFEVSKIVSARIRDGKPAYEVAWVGYKKKADRTIEYEEELEKDVPKMVKLFKSKNSITFEKIRSGKGKGKYRVSKKTP